MDISYRELSMKMSNIKFNTENKILKSATSAARKADTIYGGSNLTFGLGSLCSTENKILKQLGGGHEIKKNDCGLIHQLSYSSDEPASKKAKNELSLEIKDLIQDEIMSFESNCQYDFVWPEHVESEKSFPESSSLEAKTCMKLQKLLAKENLVNAVSISLIQGPSLKDAGDPFRVEILDKCRIVTDFDPEFILKLALYTRQELNIRTTASMLLAFASYEPRCRPFLKRYFKKCIILPTDWIAVAEQFKFINDKSDKPGFLPAALRKVLVDKFGDFDEYQLAKHNKGKKIKRQRLSIEESKKTVRFTIKKMIEILHIRDPAVLVMGILGKKYPNNVEDFFKSRLPGMWKEDLAGTRMALAVPTTWETLLSAKGNNAGCWEQLIDGKKLPYMAMLRNLRNILLAGISKKHHQAIIKQISNKNAVLKSRQFPYRFHMAQDILEDVQNVMFDEEMEKPLPKRPKVTKTFSNFAILRKQKALRTKIKAASAFCNKELFNQYRNALNEAVEISSFFNIPPIQGRTLIFLDTDKHMEKPCFAVKSLGKPMLMNKLAKIIVDMCCSACERCDVNEFFVEKNQYFEQLKFSIETQVLIDLTRNRQKVDTVLYVTNDDSEIEFATDWVRHHRALVNPQLLYVHLAIAGAKPKIENDGKHFSNDIKLMGYTDAVFRFISERCNSSRMEYIDNIDKKYQLAPIPVRVCEPIRSLTGVVSPFRWQTVRVFISSTFLDMQSERDLLVRHIFPELRRRAKALCMDVFEVDLRWGLKATEDDSVAQLCLEEVLKCQLFVGVLGDRYGAIPDRSLIKLDRSPLDCLESCPDDTSITEMEFFLGALGDARNCSENAFIYLRDNEFLKDIPYGYNYMFEDDDVEPKLRLKELKKKVKASGIEVYDNYPCCWGGVTMDGRPIIGGLEQFGQRVLDNIWNALLKMRRNGTEEIETGERHTQDAFALKQHQNFVGCEKTVSLAMKTFEILKQGVALLIGKQGAGKTALIAHLYHLVKTRWSNRCITIPFITVASPALFTLTSITDYFIEEFSRIIEIDDTISKSKGIQRFYEIVNKVVDKCGKLILFLDGIDSLPKAEHQNDVADWLNGDWPTGVVVVCSCNLNSILCKRLKNSAFVQSIPIGPLVLKDRMEIMKNRLADYGKHLDETFLNNQLRQLAMKRDSNLPLYLSLVCEDLSKFSHFDQISNKVQLIKTSVEGLIEDSVIDLEKQFGVASVEAAFAFLVVSPSGLIEEELYALMCYIDLIKMPLINDITMVRSHLNVNMPVAKFIQLIRSIRTLTENSASTISLLAASSVLRIIRERYKRSSLSSNAEVQLHRIIAGHHYGECGYGYNWSTGSFRALAVLPYHLMCGGCMNDLTNILSDLKFIKARFSLGSGAQLLEDYKYVTDMGFNNSRCSDNNKKIVEEFGNFVQRNLKILTAEPTLVVQQALNDLQCPSVAQSALDLVDITPGVMWQENKADYQMKIKMVIDAKESCLCVALSLNGQYLAFGEGAIVQLYDLYSETKSMSLVGHSAVVTCLVFADKSRLCSGSADGTISIWNIEVGHRLFILTKHIRRVSSLCLDSTKRCLVSAGWDSAVYVWRLSDGELVSSVDWKSKWSAVSCVISHPHKPMVLTGSWDGKLRIWCLQTLKRKSLLHAHSSAVLAVSMTASGTLLASSSMDMTLKIWSCEYGFQLASIQLDLAIMCLNYQLNGKDDEGHFVGSCSDGAVRMYTCKLGQLVSNANACRNSPLTCIAINQNNIVAGYEDGSAQLLKGSKNYNSETRLLTTFGSESASVTCIQFRSAYDAEYIVLGMSNGKIHVADENLCGFLTITGHRSAIKVIAVSKKYIVSGDADGVIAIDVKPWKKSIDSTCNHMAIIHGGSVTSISFRNDYRWIATTGVDENVKLWQLSVLMTNLNYQKQDLPLMTVEADLVIKSCHYSPITASCWVENSRVTESKEYCVITSGKDFKLCAWDTANGKNLWIKTNFSAPINQLFSTKNSICGFFLDGSFHVWDCMGVEIVNVSGNNEDISAVFFDLSEEKFDWYREVMEEEQEKKSTTKTKPLQCIAEQLNNIYIARCSSNGQINVIKPCFSNKAEKTVLSHKKTVQSIVHGIDGKIATCSLDGTIHVYDGFNFYEDNPDLKRKIPASGISCMSLIKLISNNVAIATGDQSGYLMVWIRNENNEWDVVTRNRVHKTALNSVVVLGTHKSIYYLLTSASNRIKYWAFGESKSVTYSHSSIKFKDDTVFKPVLIKSSFENEPQGRYKLEYKDFYPFYENILCIDYSSQKGILLLGKTDDALNTFQVEFKFGAVKPFNYSFKGSNSQVRLLSRKIENKPWNVLIKLMYEEKSSHFFAFNVNSWGELWISQYSTESFGYPGSTKNYGSVSNIGEEDISISGCPLEMFPHSMDVILVESSNDKSTFQQFIGLANGALISLRLEVCYGDITVKVLNHESNQLHQGSISSVNCHRSKYQFSTVMVFTGGDDGILRQSSLDLSSGTFTKSAHKFYCDGAVTCIKSDDKNNGQIFISCADVLGNMYAIASSC